VEVAAAGVVEVEAAVEVAAAAEAAHYAGSRPKRQ